MELTNIREEKDLITYLKAFVHMTDSHYFVLDVIRVVQGISGIITSSPITLWQQFLKIQPSFAKIVTMTTTNEPMLPIEYLGYFIIWFGTKMLPNKLMLQVHSFHVNSQQFIRQLMETGDDAAMTHPGYFCARCRSSPFLIIGIRFYCMHCRCNFCRRCMEEEQKQTTGGHPHIHEFQSFAQSPRLVAPVAPVSSVPASRSRNTKPSTGKEGKKYDLSKDTYEKIQCPNCEETKSNCFMFRHLRDKHGIRTSQPLQLSKKRSVSRSRSPSPASSANPSRKQPKRHRKKRRILNVTDINSQQYDALAESTDKDKEKKQEKQEKQETEAAEDSEETETDSENEYETEIDAETETDGKSDKDEKDEDQKQEELEAITALSKTLHPVMVPISTSSPSSQDSKMSPSEYAQHISEICMLNIHSVQIQKIVDKLAETVQREQFVYCQDDLKQLLTRTNRFLKPLKAEINKRARQLLDLPTPEQLAAAANRHEPLPRFPTTY